MRGNFSSRTTRFVRAIALVSVPTFIAACGGSGSGSATKTTVSTTQATTSPQGASTTAAQATRPIGKTVWFDGYKVTIDTASLDRTSGGGQAGVLTLAATFENLGNDPAAFNGQTAVSSHGQDFPTSGTGTVPSVPGGGKGKGSITYEVDNTFTLDDAVVTFGKPDETRAKVPLGTSGSLVALAPLAVSGLSPVSPGQVKVDLKSGEARADKTSEHGQAASGHWYVYLKGALTFSGGASGTNFGPGDVAVKLPDGTSVVGEAADSKSCCFALYPSQPPADFTFRFLVADPPSGSYTATIRSKVDGNDVSAPFTFQVAAAPAATGTTSTSIGGSGSTTSTSSGGSSTTSSSSP